MHGTGDVNVGSDYSDDEREFFAAVDAYKRKVRRNFLSLRETLRIVESLGYERARRVSPPGAGRSASEGAGP